MKRIIAVIISVVLIVTMFIACSKDETVSEIVTDENGEPVTEVVTDENGETVTEVVTDASGETVTEVVTEQVTTEDGTVETVTKTVPVTQAVTQQSTTKRTTTTTKKNTSSGSTSKETTTKKSTTTAKTTITTRPSTTKPQTTKPTTTKPTTTAHTHNWVAQTKTETTYKWEQHSICNGCGIDLTEEARKLGISVSMFHMQHYRGDGVTPCPKTLGDYSTYHYEQVKVATGTTTVVTGYKCSTCGATKDA